MATALLRQGSARRARIWVALAAAAALIAWPLLAVTPAHAEVEGYLGTGDENSLWDDQGGERTLPLMTEGVAYSGTLTGPQFGVGQPYKWVIVDGALPAGIILASPEPEEYSPSATFSGTPTAAGHFTFTLFADSGEGGFELVFDGDVAAGGPPSAPEIDLTLNFAAGTALSEASSEISAEGLKVGSDYTLTMHSTPVVLHTGIIDPTGGFTMTVALPANTPVGAHRLVLTGIAPDGTVLSVEAWFTLLANGTIGAISYTGPISLAESGTETTASIAIGSGLLALGGLALILARRRRRLIAALSGEAHRL